MIRIRSAFSLLVFLFLGSALWATGHPNWTIEVEAEGYAGEQILLAYYLGNSQYVKDTALLDNGIYRFSGEDTLGSGVYMVIFPPDNQFFQLMIGDGEDDIHVRVEMEQVTQPTEISGSEESQLFYEYLAFLKTKRPGAEALRAALDTTTSAAERAVLEESLRLVDEEVYSYQDSLLQSRPGSIAALLILTNRDILIPEFSGTEEEVQMLRYHHVKAHYFDHIPLEDPRLVRTPVLHQKIDYYVSKLTPQVADSISRSIDFILSRLDPDGEAFRVYLIHFLNYYAKSNIVGFDAVYVHLADNYYSTGLATWTDEELLAKIMKNAETLRPLLLGKTAPDLLLYDRENKPVRLHSIDAPYTVVLFWDPDCGHCKKSMPAVHDFYHAYHDRGVEVLAVCTSLGAKAEKCWETVEERDMDHWINVYDPYLRSRFKQIYDIRTTPQVYVLDRDKKILMKKIAPEKLPEIFDHFLNSDG